MHKFYTAGYGGWPTDRRVAALVASLRAAGVDLLVDVRHSPCSSAPSPAGRYGARDWHLRPGGAGIVTHLTAAGIGYLWAVELGNPQKKDPAMAVLREHLADPAGGWPVHRGLALVARLVRDEGKTCCLLCACEKYATCHRKPVAEALLGLLPEGTTHTDLGGGGTGRRPANLSN